MDVSQRTELEIDGLRAWVYPRPKRSGGVAWYVDIQDPTGRKRYAATKSLRVSTKARAIEAARKVLRSRQVLAADGGLEYLQEYWNPATSRKLKALEAAGRAPGNERIEHMEGLMRNHAIPWFTAQGVTKLSELTYSLCQDLLNEKSETLSSGTVRHLRSAVNAALQQAVREGIIASNPMRETESPRVPRQTREHIPWPQLQKILKPGNWSSRQAYTAALIALSTGMRHGELRGLLWRYVDLENGIVDVVHNLNREGLKGTKTGKPRMGLRLPALVVSELERLRPENVEPDAFVFNLKGRPVNHNYMRWHLRKAAERAGAPLNDRQTFHSLRHSSVSYGLSGAQDRARREALLQLAGHSDESMQALYSHTTEAQLEALRDEWDERFSQIG